MFVFRQSTARVLHSAALLLVASALAKADLITVTPTVTPVGGLFHYDYSIANNTADDAFLIDIPVPKEAAAIENLFAPAGFKAAFDSGLGLVSFLEDTSVFSSVPQDGFSFDSPERPAAVQFQATVFSNTSGSLYTVSGPTLAPVPEPAYWPMVALLTLTFLAVLKRRRIEVLGQE